MISAKEAKEQAQERQKTLSLAATQETIEFINDVITDAVNRGDLEVMIQSGSSRNQDSVHPRVYLNSPLVSLNQIVVSLEGLGYMVEVKKHKSYRSDEVELVDSITIYWG